MLKHIRRFGDGIEDFRLALEQYNNDGEEDDEDEEEENEDVPRYKIHHRKASIDKPQISLT